MRDRIVFLSFAAMALASCAAIEWTSVAMETDSIQYAKPLNMPKKRVTVTVFWKTEAEIGEFCRNGANACALPIESENECYIYTVKPRSWNSAPLLKRMGHELAHCLGGNHE